MQPALPTKHLALLLYQALSAKNTYNEPLSVNQQYKKRSSHEEHHRHADQGCASEG
jgi:hypothetical protein